MRNIGKIILNIFIILLLLFAFIGSNIIKFGPCREHNLNYANCFIGYMGWWIPIYLAGAMAVLLIILVRRRR